MLAKTLELEQDGFVGAADDSLEFELGVVVERVTHKNAAAIATTAPSAARQEPTSATSIIITSAGFVVLERIYHVIEAITHDLPLAGRGGERV